MRIFASVFSQETNTFSPILTDVQLFKRGYAYKGCEVVENLANSNTEAGGVIDYCKTNNIEVVWGPAYYAVAAGKIKDETFKAIEEEIIESLKNAGKLDGIILCLHGALVAESYDDCEGKLLTDIRNLVGNEIPISLTLDYHANLTKLMLCKALHKKGLINCIPDLTSTAPRLHPIAGRMGDPRIKVQGCCFADRCPNATEKCKTTPPPMVYEGEHGILCHLYSKEGA